MRRITPILLIVVLAVAPVPSLARVTGTVAPENLYINMSYGGALIEFAGTTVLTDNIGKSIKFCENSTPANCIYGWIGAAGAGAVTWSDEVFTSFGSNDAGWTVTGGGASCTAAAAATGTACIMFEEEAAVDNATVKLTYTVTGSTGSVIGEAGPGIVGTERSGDGTWTDYILFPGGWLQAGAVVGASAFSGVVSGVSAKYITEPSSAGVTIVSSETSTVRAWGVGTALNNDPLGYTYYIGPGDAPYFVDTGLATGADDGTSWPDAFQTIAAMEAGLLWDDTVYIKATGTPIRETLGVGLPLSSLTIYGDAVGGSATETTRGATKAEFWGSVDLTGYAWTQEGASNVYRTAYDITGTYLDTTGVAATLPTAWWYNGATVTALASLGATDDNCPADVTTLAANSLCQKKSTGQVWVNIGKAPTGEHIEILKYDHPVEIWTGQKLYNVAAKHGASGMLNAGCYLWTISGLEAAYNIDGVSPSSSQVNAGTYLENSLIHDNGRHGVSLAGFQKNITIRNSRIYSNGSDGIQAFPAASMAVSDMSYIYNNTIYGNGAYGVNLQAYDAMTTCRYTVRNNIATGNGTAQFNAENDAQVVLTAGNNCPGADDQYAGKWAANKGTGNVEVDPGLDANYGVRMTSSVIGKGTDVGYGRDIGKPRLRGNVLMIR